MDQYELDDRNDELNELMDVKGEREGFQEKRKKRLNPWERGLV